jgi:hemolysin activation/secretion protein
MAVSMNRCTMFDRGFSVTACVLLCAVSTVQAQTGPDAGQVLREQMAPAPLLPRQAVGVRLLIPTSEPTLPGGDKVVLKSARVRGNSVLSEFELLKSIGDVANQSFDLAGLRRLAEKVAETYHAEGFPFARVFLPPQNLHGGELLIEVIEGRYGEVKVTGNPAMASQAHVFLSRLRSGAVMASGSLERATMILDDQPGVRTASIVRPGDAFGTGDLEVEVQRTPLVRGNTIYDNHGNRYTGDHRLQVNMWLDSPFTLGDQFQISALTTSEQLWLSSINYNFPVGGDGWRAYVGSVRTKYSLGKELAASDAKGSANVLTVGVSYPLVRSRELNLTVSMTVQRKKLNALDGNNTKEDWFSDSTPLSLQFDQRDTFGGGGVNYGNLMYAPGRLTLQGEKLSRDVISGLNASGGFNKWNLDIARIQATPLTGLSLFGRYSGQQASKNLDSSEKFGLGGPQGVRAYSTGAVFGDIGWLTQLEVRYALGHFSPYAFYDVGALRINAKPDALMTVPTINKRSISGAGFGTRYAQGLWTLDAALAWRRSGEVEDANIRRNPRAWVTASYKF